MSNTITIHGKQVQEDMIQMADACDNYKWTDEADAWFRTKIREWAASN